MIIGVSGKIGNGKDTVGQMIQYLTSDSYKNKLSYDEYLNTIDVSSSWQIKKFADKLKDIVCLLLGCTRKQLEDRKFKEKELEEEWWYYKYQLGYSNSVGFLEFEKNENGERINHPIIDVKTGKPVWKFLSKECYDSMSEEKRKFHKAELVKLTPRLILQLLGTEGGRDIIHPNIWVNSLFSDYKPLTLYGDPRIEAVQGFGADMETILPNWIITDTRFVNEADGVKNKNGIVIRVNRPHFEAFPSSTIYGMDYVIPSKKPFKHEHESETALDDYTNFDYIIENNGTIEELLEKVKEILKKEGII